jgi:hypothetical protein
MNEEKIKVTISKDGSMKVEAEGFKGPACSVEVGKLILGTKTSDKKKPAYYEEAENKVSIRT